jgi:hypothetical protein
MHFAKFGLVALIVCRGALAQQEPPAPPPAPPPVEPVMPTAEVMLVEAGAEPRQVLRLAPAPGMEQACRMRLAMSVTTKMGDQQVPSAPMPTMVTTMRLKVAEVAPGGDISYDMAISECHAEEGPELVPGMAEMLNQTLEPLKRLTGRWTINNRGVVKNVKFTIPDDVPGNVKAMMVGLSDQVNQLSAPLPEEAIGPGGKWRVKTRIKVQGLLVDQAMEYTLKEVRDGTAIVDVAVEQNAAPQKFESPALPPGTTMNLESLKSTGSGTGELPLNGVVPSRLSNKVTTGLTLEMKEGDKTTRIDQSIKLDMAWVRAEATEAPPKTPPSGVAPATNPPAPTPPPPAPTQPPPAPPTGPPK